MNQTYQWRIEKSIPSLTKRNWVSDILEQPPITHILIHHRTSLLNDSNCWNSGNSNEVERPTASVRWSTRWQFHIVEHYFCCELFPLNHDKHLQLSLTAAWTPDLAPSASTTRGMRPRETFITVIHLHSESHSKHIHIKGIHINIVFKSKAHISVLVRIPKALAEIPQRGQCGTQWVSSAKATLSMITVEQTSQIQNIHSLHQLSKVNRLVFWMHGIAFHPGASMMNPLDF